MRTYIPLLPIALLFMGISFLQADTIHVPSQQPTIQAGIDAAVDWDTVLVADGTYTGDGNRDIDFLGKAIVVMSENGSDYCIIDCESAEEDWHGGFYFHNGETSSSVVQGFTIRNGYSAYGGAILCEWSHPTISGNAFTANSASSGGGAGAETPGPGEGS